MATWLRQSTAVDIPLGPFLDETDGKTAETSLTISQADVRLKKNNGNWAQKSDNTSLAHEENGWYECELDATDTNTLGVLVVAVHEAGALPVWREFLVVPANVWDSYLGSDFLQVDVAQFGGSNLTASGGRPEVNTTHAAGTAWGSGAITASALAGDAITAAKVASDVGTEIATAVWASGTRTLSALDEDNTTLDLDATIRAAVGLASADLDTQLSAIESQTDDIGVAGAGLTAIPWNSAWDTEVQSEAADALNAYDPPTRAELTSDTNSIISAIGGLNDVSILDIFTTPVEGSYSFVELLRGFAAALFGKVSGAGSTTVTFRNTNDDVDVIVATVDADGNRSAITLDLTDTP